MDFAAFTLPCLIVFTTFFPPWITTAFNSWGALNTIYLYPILAFAARFMDVSNIVGLPAPAPPGSTLAANSPPLVG
jgi:hypothetical protein